MVKDNSNPEKPVVHDRAQAQRRMQDVVERDVTKELVRNRAFDTRDDARAEVFEYIEVFYNRLRAHSLLSYDTPDAFEDCFEKENAA